MLSTHYHYNACAATYCGISPQTLPCETLIVYQVAAVRLTPSRRRQTAQVLREHPAPGVLALSEQCANVAKRRNAVRSAQQRGFPSARRTAKSPRQGILHAKLNLLRSDKRRNARLKRALRCKHVIFYSSGENSSLPTPHSGHVKSSGTSAHVAAGSDSVVGIAGFLVIDISADVAYVLHLKTSFLRPLPHSYGNYTTPRNYFQYQSAFATLALRSRQARPPSPPFRPQERTRLQSFS